MSWCQSTDSNLNTDPSWLPTRLNGVQGSFSTRTMLEPSGKYPLRWLGSLMIPSLLLALSVAMISLLMSDRVEPLVARAACAGRSSLHLTLIGQQAAAILNEHFAQHLRAVPLEMTHETVHRVLAALVVREVAGVAEHILEAVAVDIRADPLEVEAGDPHGASNVVRGLQFQLGMCLG